jgi:uncharacterized membrane protein YkoI
MRHIIYTFLAFTLIFSTVADAKDRSVKKSIGKNRAAHLVKKQYPGKVLKVKDANKHYKVRVLQPKGRVLDVTVNKKSGLVKKGKN